MKRRTNKKTNPRLVNLISLLKDTSRQNEVNVWRDVAVRLEAPARNYAEVNLSKINRYAGDGETIVVPGKVLGSGMLETSVKIAALTFSQSAATKILEANGQCLTIEELVKDNP
ncbi:MAG TPA: 50S ribosomal protein L18e, partial [Methanolinea sp.]|nr:50S ribosomal protein L18e [Methanolinea sp.]